MNLQKEDEFFEGVKCGMCLDEQKIIAAHKRQEPLKVRHELFYLVSVREGLAEFLEKICK